MARRTGNTVPMHGVSPGHADHEPSLRLCVYPGADSSKLVELLMANGSSQEFRDGALSFATPDRTFIIEPAPIALTGPTADLPSADLSIIVVDAADGLTQDARRDIAAA